MDNSRFIYKKVQIIEENTTYFYWYLIDKKSRNGVHFHGCQYSESYEHKGYCPWDGAHGRNKFRFSTYGIEIHSTKPLYEDQRHLENCEVTGGNCFCDGTSLMADRELGFIDPNGTDDTYVWNTLHKWYETHFPTDKDNQ